MLLESADRASGYFTTLSQTQPDMNARTSGVYLRAEPAEIAIMDGRDDQQRIDLIAERLSHWKAIRSA